MSYTSTLNIENKVDIFWENVKKHEAIIKRCFNYLLRRFPDYDGKDSAYNNMIIRLWELDVLFRFNIKRVLAKRLDVSEESISDDLITKESLKAHGSGL